MNIFEQNFLKTDLYEFITCSVLCTKLDKSLIFPRIFVLLICSVFFFTFLPSPKSKWNIPTTSLSWKIQIYCQNLNFILLIDEGMETWDDLHVYARHTPTVYAVISLCEASVNFCGKIYFCIKNTNISWICIFYTALYLNTCKSKMVCAYLKIIK